MIASGITNIGKANYAKKGIYFQAFTGFSTGLERLGKLCALVDQIIYFKGLPPQDEFAKLLKGELRHDLIKISAKCDEIKMRRGFRFEFDQDINNEVSQKILQIMSRFAKGDRYSNIDFLTSTRDYIDPIVAWCTEVDLYIYDKLLSNKRKLRITKQAHLTSGLLQDSATVYFVSDSGVELTSVFEASWNTGVFEAVSPIRQLCLLKIARYFLELLRSLESEARGVCGEYIPFFSELFACYYNPDAVLKRIKNWERIA